MLPGYVSGFYTLEACHIDLARLTQFAGARLILAPATGVDPSSQRVLFSDRPPLPYDILSINIGITPAVESVPGAAEFATPVKPISTFAAKLDAMLAAVRASSEPFKVVLVGGGPGGVELACALNYRLTREREKAGIDAPVPVTIVSRGPILAELASYARRAMLPLLEERGIAVREVEGGATSVSSGCVNLADGSELAFDSCLWCTEAAAAPWLAETWLPTDDRGFLQVNEFLQSDGGPENVFASGDIASSTATPRPKAGVYAVRAVS